MTHPAVPQPLPARRAPWARVSPDWFILGVDAPPGVQIFASNELSLATLEVIVDEGSWTPFGARFEDRVSGVKITATGKHYVMTFGNTYAEAIAALFAFWTPEAGKRELGRG